MEKPKISVASGGIVPAKLWAFDYCLKQTTQKLRKTDRRGKTALVKCPEYGNQVSEKAVSCPRCGWPFSEIIKGVSDGPIQPTGVKTERAESTKGPPQDSNPIKIIVGVPVLVLVVIAGVVGVMHFRSTEEENKLNKSQSREAKRPETLVGSDITVNTIGIPLTASMGGELIPVVCGRGSAIGLGDPSVQFQITNHKQEAATLSLWAEIPDWSECSEKTVEIGPRETKTIPLTLTFKPRFYNNPEQVDAQLNYKVTYNGTLVSKGSDTKPVKIAASETMLWGPRTFHLIAAFVCPKGATVNRIAQKAKERMGNRSLSGYHGNTVQQAKAIFFALGADCNLSYVNDPVSFSKGFTQIVRAPRESFGYASANCIDGAVLYASVFENLGMEPLIILGSGHAFVAVRNSAGGPIICIETTLTSNAKRATLSWLKYGGAFESAVACGDSEYVQWSRSPQKSGIQVIDIKRERQAGIYPLFTDEK